MPISTTRPSKARLKKSLFDDSEKTRLNCEMEKTLYKRIQKRAIDEERTVSKITRQLWVEYLERVEQPEN